MTLEMKTSSVDERLDIPKLVPDDDPILHRPCKPFDFDGDIDAGKLADTLFSAMEFYRGVGLSACQIGIDARVFVMGFGPNGQGVKFECFNPKVMDITGKDIMLFEGCLSYPHTEMLVKRPGAIMVTFQDRTGKYHQEMYSGFTARVFLHEYDHMEGITFRDRVSKFKWDIARKKSNKIKMKISRRK